MRMSHAVPGIVVFGLLISVASSVVAQSIPPWTGTWAVAPQSDGGDTFGDQTVRQVVHTSVSGTTARIRLSNKFGSDPVTVQDVHIALQDSGSSTQSATDEPITFAGSTSVVLQPGQDVYSDAIAFVVPQGGDVAVSYYLPQVTPIQTYHSLGNQDSWVANGDVSANAAITVASTHQSYFLLTGLDVQNTALKGAVAAIGASITDGFRSSYGQNHRWSNFLANRLNAANAQVGVLNLGITGNDLLKDGGGQAMVTRFAHDVLQQSNARWTIISDDPINDLLDPHGPPTLAALQKGLSTLILEAHGQGTRVICSTLTPFGGYVNGTQQWTPALESEREQYNAFVTSGTSGCDEVLDQDAATHDPAHPTQFLPAYDSGDHLHPNDAGYQAIANAVDLTWFATVPPPGPGPQSGATYHLISQQTGLALDNAGSTSARTAVTQWGDDPSNINQAWTITSVGNGYFMLVNQRSGMALDDGGSDTDGTAVTQYPADPTNANQYWQFVAIGNGEYHVVCKASGKALDNAGLATQGSVVTQWHDDGPSNVHQGWSLDLISLP